jgi:RNA polymerase sigma-70 factor (ECF subfamily)
MEKSSDIISLIRQGNQKAFESLFKEYYGRLCEYSYMLTKDKEAAREIVQDFFVKLWENRAKLEIKMAKAYLFKAVHNNSIKYINKKNNFESIIRDKEYGSISQGDFELTENLEKSINELPLKCREIFLMSRMDRLRHNEIAEKLGISAKTVEVQIRKANLILKEKLKEFMFLFLF